jgi:hypothetical protein
VTALKRSCFLLTICGIATPITCACVTRRFIKILVVGGGARIFAILGICYSPDLVGDSALIRYISGVKANAICIGYKPEKDRNLTICVSHLHCSYGSPIFECLDPNNFEVEENGCKIKILGVGIIKIGPFCES